LESLEAPPQYFVTFKLKVMLKSILYTAFSLLIINVLYSQGTLKINGANLVASGNVHLVLNNTNWQNDGTFTPSTSTLFITGNAAQAQASIGGTTATTFNNLTVNKSANNAQLQQNITVSNALALTMGCMDVSNYSLTASGGVTYATTCFVKTSGTGALKRNVGTTAVMFPVGVNSFTPLSLTNSGTADNFTVRATNQVLTNGNSGTALTANVVNTTWHVSEEVTGGSNVNMTATWHASDEATEFSRNNCFIQHYTSSAWQTTTGAAATGSNPYSISRNGLTAFSPFSVASTTAVLSVELLNFSGYTEGSSNRLVWATANEINNKGFYIERLMDNGKWLILGFVEAKGKAAIYDFVDKNPLSVSYYRLRQIDNDGKETLSKVISLSSKGDKQLKVSPNPSTDVIVVETSSRFQTSTTLGSAETTFEVFNILGKKVLEGKMNQSVDVSSLSNGSYIVRVGLEQVKFVKQ
jgi:Secretion system C-terminal sorting domain